MSYCELILFKEGKPAYSIVYDNAIGGAPYIWKNVFDGYLESTMKGPTYGWISAAKTGALWEVAKRKDVPFFVRAVFVFTFDRAIVQYKNFKTFANHLRDFLERFPPLQSLCHLTKWIDFFETSTVPAIGLYPTSVGENLWIGSSSEGAPILYDLNERTDHLEVYQWLQEKDARVLNEN